MCYHYEEPPALAKLAPGCPEPLTKAVQGRCRVLDQDAPASPVREGVGDPCVVCVGLGGQVTGQLEANRAVGIPIVVERPLVGSDHVVGRDEDAREIDPTRVVTKGTEGLDVGHRKCAPLRTPGPTPRSATSLITPCRRTRSSSPVASTTVLAPPRGSSRPWRSSSQGAPGLPVQAARASSRVLAGGAPLRFRLVAVTGPKPSSARRTARAWANGCDEQRSPRVRAGPSTPGAHGLRQRTTRVRGPGQKAATRLSAAGPSSHPSAPHISGPVTRTERGCSASRPFQSWSAAIARGDRASAPRP